MTQTADPAFKPINFMGLSMRNRFIRSATIEGLADPEGAPGQRLEGLYRDLGTGGTMAGTHNSRGPLDKKEWTEGFYLEGAKKVKARVDLPVCAVGGIRTLEMVAAILSGGIADLISLSRPVIREPALINRWAGGDRSPTTCISCNGCFTMMTKGQGIFCVQEVKSNPEK